MTVRCVVTGQDATGKSVFVADEQRPSLEMALLPPGSEFHRLWGEDGTPALPTDGSQPEQPTFFPAAGGYRFLFFTLAPHGTSVDLPDDMDAAVVELNEKLPGMSDWMEPDNPGMHTTDTVDIDIVLSGEVWLELDDGAEVHLLPGDCVIQNGTRHLWNNKGDVPCRMFAALIGATRAGS